MYKYDYEVERYEVHYLDKGIVRIRRFKEVEKAIDFASEKLDNGVDADIKQIVNLIGWY